MSSHRFLGPLSPKSRLLLLLTGVASVAGFGFGLADFGLDAKTAADPFIQAYFWPAISWGLVGGWRVRSRLAGVFENLLPFGCLASWLVAWLLFFMLLPYGVFGGGIYEFVRHYRGTLV